VESAAINQSSVMCARLAHKLLRPVAGMSRFVCKIHIIGLRVGERNGAALFKPPRHSASARSDQSSQQSQFLLNSAFAASRDGV
jgi:hypothetical protein